MRRAHEALLASRCGYSATGGEPGTRRSSPTSIALPRACATQTSLPWRQRTTSYRFSFHKMFKAGWKYSEDDVDRYCPDRKLILKLYEEATG